MLFLVLNVGWLETNKPSTADTHTGTPNIKGPNWSETISHPAAQPDHEGRLPGNVTRVFWRGGCWEYFCHCHLSECLNVQTIHSFQWRNVLHSQPKLDKFHKGRGEGEERGRKGRGRRWCKAKHQSPNTVHCFLWWVSTPTKDSCRSKVCF